MYNFVERNPQTKIEYPQLCKSTDMVIMQNGMLPVCAVYTKMGTERPQSIFSLLYGRKRKIREA